jgi:hypothetical protein
MFLLSINYQPIAPVHEFYLRLYSIHNYILYASKPNP